MKKEKMPVGFAEPFQEAWEEIRLCAALLKAGKAKIAVGVRRDGSIYRYTKKKRRHR